MAQRNIFFLFFNGAWLLLFYTPLKELLALSLQSELYSHTVLIPFVSGYLLYTKKKEISAAARYPYAQGIALSVLGMVLYLIVRRMGAKLSQNDLVAFMVLSGLIVWAGGFMFFYGFRAFRTALFPLLFLVFMVPAPDLLMDRIIRFLQVGSTGVTYVFFKLLGIPFEHEGFVFNLPGITIEVAQQCSGIRSSIVLFILGVLSSFLFLKTVSRRAVLLCIILPLAVIKNAIRIVTLSVLAIYVNEGFVGTNDLHNKGGFVFFLIAASIFMLILWMLRRSEEKINR